MALEQEYITDTEILDGNAEGLNGEEYTDRYMMAICNKIEENPDMDPLGHPYAKFHPPMRKYLIQLCDLYRLHKEHPVEGLEFHVDEGLVYTSVHERFQSVEDYPGEYYIGETAEHSSVTWYTKGIIGRPSGKPAKIKGDGTLIWHLYGYPGREDGKPVFEKPDGAYGWLDRESRLHRADGEPALFEPDGKMSWYTHGGLIKEETPFMFKPCNS